MCMVVSNSFRNVCSSAARAVRKASSLTTLTHVFGGREGNGCAVRGYLFFKKDSSFSKSENRLFTAHEDRPLDITTTKTTYLDPQLSIAFTRSKVSSVTVNMLLPKRGENCFGGKYRSSSVGVAIIRNTYLNCDTASSLDLESATFK